MVCLEVIHTCTRGVVVDLESGPRSNEWMKRMVCRHSSFSVCFSMIFTISCRQIWMTEKSVSSSLEVEDWSPLLRATPFFLCYNKSGVKFCSPSQINTHPIRNTMSSLFRSKKNVHLSPAALQQKKIHRMEHFKFLTYIMVPIAFAIGINRFEDQFLWLGVKVMFSCVIRSEDKRV